MVRGDNAAMPLVPIKAREAMDRLDGFDALLDARSPAEFAEDRLPGAENWPVLDNDERRSVGTEYKQISPFDARKRGAALVARNVARHLEQWVQDKPKGWRPLVYCWRGGQRSGTLAWFLGQIGFYTQVIEGGYKAFRTELLAELDTAPARFEWRVVCGKTGSGKTRLLQALGAAGAQVLDLEGLACHRGSVLGHLPGQPQPTQKAFETGVWDRLRQFDPARPVFVESESGKIGNLRVPLALIERVRQHGTCLRVDLPDAGRLQLLLEDYDFYLRDIDLFCGHLDALVELRGKATVAAWQDAARAGRLPEVFLDLMHRHYDPTYLRSMPRNFAGYDAAVAIELDDASPASLQATAARLTGTAGAS